MAASATSTCPESISFRTDAHDSDSYSCFLGIISSVSSSVASGTSLDCIIMVVFVYVGGLQV